MKQYKYAFLALFLIFITLNVTPSFATNISDYLEPLNEANELNEQTPSKYTEINNLATNLQLPPFEQPYMVKDLRYIEKNLNEKNKTQITVYNSSVPQSDTIVQLRSFQDAQDPAFKTEESQAYLLHYWYVENITHEDNQWCVHLYNGGNHVVLSYAEFEKLFTGLSFRTPPSGENELTGCAFVKYIYALKNADLDTQKDKYDHTVAQILNITFMVLFILAMICGAFLIAGKGLVKGGFIAEHPVPPPPGAGCCASVKYTFARFFAFFGRMEGLAITIIILAAASTLIKFIYDRIVDHVDELKKKQAYWEYIKITYNNQILFKDFEDVGG